MMDMPAAACDAGLAHALALGEEMLVAAKAGQWESVDALSAQCDALVRQPHAEDEASRDAMQTLVQQHLVVCELAGVARDDVARKLEQHRYGHRAVSAYLAPTG